MKSLVDIDFAGIEVRIIKQTIQHYKFMCDNAREVIDNDPFIPYYISSCTPIKLEYNEHDPDTVIVQWAEADYIRDDGVSLECKEHKLDIKILTYSEAEIKSYLGARKKQYEFELKKILERKAEEREFEIYKNLKKKYEKDKVKWKYLYYLSDN